MLFTQSAMLVSSVTLSLIFSVVINRVQSDTWSKNNLDNSGYENDGYDDHTSEVTTSEGYGLFRDPLEVLGPRFTRSCMRDLCENTVQMRADNVVHDVRFTRRGARLCTDVCTQYRENMGKNRAAVDVHAWPGYCDFTGTLDGPSGTDDLGTACTCAYKVRCQRRTELVLYSFEADATGNVRVSVTESDRKHYVTAYLLSVYLMERGEPSGPGMLLRPRFRRRRRRR